MSIITLLGVLLSVSSLSHARLSDYFNWTSIEPTWSLRYTPCYEKYECARLLLPLDWLNVQAAKDNDTIALAVIKLPARVDVGDKSFGGTVIVNPGGPGDSGVTEILKNGHFLRNMVDGNLHFEVLSFDPRGMAHSTPVADCYDSEVERTVATWQNRGLGRFDESRGSFGQQKALAAAFGRRCEYAEAQNPPIRKFMSSASVARDMLEIVEQIELTKQSELLSRSTRGKAQQPLASTEVVKTARIQYYGTSYGTFLGNTFLSMFPGRVHRMILDGVVVPEEWVEVDWRSNIIDTENAVEYFYKTCFEATSKCALWRDSDGSWKSIKARVDEMVDELDTNPLPVYAGNGVQTFLTGRDVLATMGDPLYTPLDFFESLAVMLDDSLQGNHTRVLEQLGLSGQLDVCSPPSERRYDMTSAGIANRCGDGKDVTGYGFAYWKSYTRELMARSPLFGYDVASTAFACAGWTLRPKHRFDGPFTSPAADARMRAGKPSAPLLLLSSFYDPITPLSSAHKVAKAHPGARVVVQKSVGHCASLSAPSECTNKIVRTYMETGQMPAAGVECEPDCVPWKHCPHERARLPR
ncbi:hypothetical protein QQS21_003648 [Conoideocrella luteorostrata]|uniref:Peptidase S33 tripeptidyl aminopeptidase-like C-terminal domain-containing protein n=1 Tax=Conoideocrella luteorostrata TaxID=1105319 RepID=A0AAJ0CX02_9HYPO|nr:hypothetical protein QQS21_003648 [Conoideocrella luteorostrata]